MAANSADHASSSTKCHSAILRRLLCSGSLPTHPSDQLVESSIGKSGDQKAEKSSKPGDNNANSNPGVVARLMGLDSFPNTPLAPKDTTLGTFLRSRSLSSIDFLSHFDPIKQHRRVRTSVSFREGINYHDYISVVSNLENLGGNGEEGEERYKKKKRVRSENSGKLREKKVIKKASKKVVMEEQRRSVCVKLSSQKKDLHAKKRESLKERRPVIKKVNSKEEMMPSKCLKKRQNKILAHKVHSGCKVHPEGILPEVAGGQHSRQNPPSQIAHSQSPYSNSAHSHNGETKAITYKGKKEKKVNIINESCYYKRMVEIICGLTEESVNENWIYEVALNLEDFEEICKQFGQEILEVLLIQFVDELVQPILGERSKMLIFN